MSLLIKMRSFRFFWSIRYRLQTVWFYFNRFFYMQDERIREDKESFAITRQIAQRILPSLGRAILAVFIFYIYDKCLYSLASDTSFLPAAVKAWLTNVYKTVEVNKDVNTNLLTLVASIAGVYIGLYFTAVSVVAGAVFSTTPPVLRELLLKEKVGNQYVSVLSVLTCICILILGASSFGFFPGPITLFLVSLLSAYGVFCFAVLGFRAFSLFDVTTLGATIICDVYRAIRLATIRGYRWDDKSFQAHYYKIAASCINQMDTLINHCMAENATDSKAISSLLIDIIRLLREYSLLKTEIPTDSFWFKRIPKHKKWFLADNSIIELALKTDTTIQPEMLPHQNWFEDQLVALVERAFGKMLKESSSANMESVYHVMDVFSQYLELQGQQMEISKARKHLKDLANKLETVATSAKDQDMGYALADVVAVNAISLALGFFKRFRDRPVSHLTFSLSNLRWSDTRSIYFLGYPAIMLQTLEDLRTKIAFEMQVEGKKISPDWYINEIVLASYSDIINDALVSLVEMLKENSLDAARGMLDQQNIVLAVSRLHRGLELCSKLNTNCNDFEKVTEEILKTRKHPEIIVKEMDWKGLRIQLDEIENSLIIELSKCLSGLSKACQGRDIPDLFGQSYHVVCERIFSSLVNKKWSLFVQLFPYLFNAALTAYDELKNSPTDMRPEHFERLTFEPLHDMLEFSGYALIFAELESRPEVWNLCSSIWDEYIGSRAEPRKVLQAYISVYEQIDAPFAGIFPRDILRTRWKLTFNNVLREQGLIKEDYSYSFSGRPRREMIHKSPVISALCAGRYEPFVEASEVFIVKYILRHVQGIGLSFRDKRGFGKRLAKEEAGDSGVVDGTI